MIYKENPFYNIDEIISHPLRVPFVMSPESLDLIRCMLHRDVRSRPTIDEVLSHVWFRRTASPTTHIPTDLTTTL
jgi:protein-serine/threonine kinase